MPETQQPFSLDAPKYDTTTYLGRFQHFVDLVGPRALFYTDNDIKASQALLTQYKNGELAKTVMDAELWKARSVVESCVHPQSGEPLNVLFRLSAFVPVNIPICAGMLLAQPTLFNTVFWQWFNQSYNAGFNYANRNTSGTQNNSDIFKSYALATGISVSAAVGLGKVVEKADKLSPGLRMILKSAVPYTAVAMAGAVNAVAMRQNELRDGIDVMDADGTVLGRSKVAAKKSLTEVALTRIAIPAPILLLPPYVLSAIKAANMMPAGRYGRVATELAAISLFPQKGSISLDSLEPEIKKGHTPRTVFYNKGI